MPAIYSSVVLQCPISKLKKRKEIHSSNDGLQTPLRKGTCRHDTNPVGLKPRIRF